MSSQSTDPMEDVKVFLPTDMDAEIEDQLEYGDSKSGWIREAARQRLRAETDDSDTTEK